MAAQKRKTTKGTKNSGSGRTRKKAVQQEIQEETSFFRAEFGILISFALAVILFLSNFHLCGAVGDFLRSVQLGLFGCMGFLAPIVIFIGTVFCVSNAQDFRALRKFAAVIVLILVICGFAQLFFGGEPADGTGLMSAYQASSVNGSGGGLIGGLICFVLRAAIGTVGAFIVLAAVFVLCAVCITEKSLVRAVKQRSDRVYQYANEEMAIRREIREEKRAIQEEERAVRAEERRQKRLERLRGVNISSTDLSIDHMMDRDIEPIGMPDIDTDQSEMYADQSEAITDPVKQTYAVDYDKASSEQTGRQERLTMPVKSAESKSESRTQNAVNTAELNKTVKASDKVRPETDTGHGAEELETIQQYDEDSAPFEADRTISAAESAQRLVEEGLSRFRNLDDVFSDNPSEVPMADDLDQFRQIPISGLPEEEEEIFIRPAESPYKQDDSSTLESHPVPSEETTLYPDDKAIDSVKKASYSDVKVSHLKNTAFRSGNSDLSSDEDTRSEIPIGMMEYEPLPDPDPDAAVPKVPAAYIPPTAEDEPVFEEAYEKPAMSDGVFKTAGGERRVITATGKIIDTDTEALQKKLESARQEAKAAQMDEEEIEVADEIREKEEEPKKEYVFPPLGLLKKGSRIASNHSEQEFRETAIKLEQTLRTFGVGVTVTNISCGPNVTRYELHPEMGVKVSKIVGLSDDIKLSLAAEDIRIEAPIPGKSAVGIEVPNKTQSMVYLRDLLEADNFQSHGSTLAFAVGKDIGGQVVVTDIAKMPHLLIAGQTGSGKSVCINTLIMSVIYKAKPEDVKLILIDPKVVELSIYNGIPHLLIPVVTDPKKAAGALNWAVAEMTDRYKKFAKYGVRDIKGYNAKVDSIKDIQDDNKPQKLAKIVIVIDELADLMMVASGEVEDAICRLAQLARACGIHLVIATQRPSVNVITGLIKANVPSRIAFSVASGVDSRTILDMYGAEKLLGHGDMLFYPAGYPKPQRVQGAFVSDDEVQAVCDFLSDQGMTANFDAEVEKKMAAAPVGGAMNASGGSDAKNGRDEYFAEAGRFIIEKDKASIGMLQRMFKIGFNRAARVMDQLAEAGVVGEEEGTKPRKILMTMSEFEEFLSYQD